MPILPGFFRDDRLRISSYLVSKSTELLIRAVGLRFFFRGASQPAAMSMIANPIASIPSPLDDETSRDRPHPPRGVSRHYVAPIYWGTDRHDAYSLLHNASCRFFRIGSRQFGVTAHHVIAEYLRDRDAHPAVHLMIRNTEVAGWDARQIAGDRGLDIVTFEVTDKEFEEIAAPCFDWPATNGRRRRTRIVVSFSLAMPASIGASSTGRRLSSGRPR